MALVLVLGLMSVLAIVVVAFASLMRTERYVSRGYADAVRAENLVDVALLRAMENVDRTMEGYTYPCWMGVTPANRPDALSSQAPQIVRTSSRGVGRTAYRRFCGPMRARPLPFADGPTSSRPTV